MADADAERLPARGRRMRARQAESATAYQLAGRLLKTFARRETMTESDHSSPEDPRKAAMEALADFDRKEAERLEEQAAKAAEKEKRKGRRLIFQWAIIIVCLGVIGYQMPRLAGALGSKEKPLRRGTMATDALTDQCIANLWKVSKQLQEGRPVGADLVCPASNQPFEIRTVGDDTVARSPKPELYGFREIRVSKNKPVPELIK